MLYAQNGDRIVTVDSMTSLHPVCRSVMSGIVNLVNFDEVNDML